MKMFLMALVMLGMTGCVYVATSEQWEINKAISACNGLERVSRIESKGPAFWVEEPGITVMCIDGTRYKIPPTP